jgi:hypothetical protein
MDRNDTAKKVCGPELHFTQNVLDPNKILGVCERELRVFYKKI